METEAEPYTPLSIKRYGYPTYGPKFGWEVGYVNYLKRGVWGICVTGTDEMDAYLAALKKLAQMKRKADKRRSKRNAQT